MKPPILVGIGLAIVIVAASLLAPALRGAARKAQEQAEEQAALAVRELHRVNLGLPRLSELIDADALGEADLEPIVAAAREQLQEMAREHAGLLQKAQQAAERAGLSPGPIRPVSATAAGARQALAAFQQALRDNDALLDKALADATAAVQADGSVPGAHQALGMVECVRAAGLLSEAHALRRRQSIAQSRLLGLAADWKHTQGYLDHFRGLDVAPIMAVVRTEVDDVSARRAAAAARVSDLAAQVAQRETALAQLKQQLRAARVELLDLEERGFTPGNDASFEAYRAQYRALTHVLQELQEREQLLRYGGLRAAEVVGDDPVTAEIVGGEQVHGLEELHHRLAMAEEAARRVNRANVALDEHVKYVRDAGQRAQAEAQRYQTLLAGLEAEQKEAGAEILSLATEALQQEGQALSAAEKAARAFNQSQRAADTRLRQIREQQRERDPQRKNDRLRILLQDKYIEHVGRSAEAAARVLAGRIHAQRIESSRRLLADMELYAEINPEFEFDASPFENLLDTARDAGRQTVEEARDAYATILEKLENEPTVWVPLAALAATHHLLARLDEVEAGAHAEMAARFIQQAVERREESPYVKHYVRFRDHLSGVGAAPAAPAEEEDIFGDEDDIFAD